MASTLAKFLTVGISYYIFSCPVFSSPATSCSESFSPVSSSLATSCPESFSPEYFSPESFSPESFSPESFSPESFSLATSCVLRPHVS